ncbi:PREDICTED: uncharacterized protein LOC108558168 isoform X2 [Nicrophorus vespilloides]|uniref:RING-type E3 ubiquitin transferase n=1 Tax=Nicrophorus vespilloides TaxID=110193 RepID=A0ABM1M7D3_NICVS|nr:PREDICTED: uncharacterized protein LOC108558168 isoform X2 [Nicrophorus vespilloides]
MADSSYFLKILKENEKPRSTEFLQHKEQRYERLTNQFYLVMTSQYFSKHKVAEKLALKILHLLETDEYPDEYCRDYKMQKKYLSYHLFMARNRQNTSKAPENCNMDMHMEQLENFLHYINVQDFNAATKIATSEVSKIFKEPAQNQAYQIGKYKYAGNCNIYIMMYYFMHIQVMNEIKHDILIDLQVYLEKSIQRDIHLLPQAFVHCMRSEMPRCHRCLGTTYEFCLNAFYVYSMIKLNRDMSINFAKFDTIPAKWNHSIYCPIDEEREPVPPTVIPLPYKLYAPSPSLDLCRGTFSNVIDTVIINLCKRSVLCVMCMCYKDWSIDRSSVMWKKVGQRSTTFDIKSIDILLRMGNNLTIKFNKDLGTDGEETGEERVVEEAAVVKTKVAKQSKKKKMINQIVQTKSPLKDCRIKQTQTCMEESVIKDDKKLQQRVKALESEKSRMQKEMNDLKKKMDKMSMKTSDINNKLQTSQNALKAREEELKGFKQKVDILMNLNLSNEQNVAKWSYDYEILCTKYNTLQVCSRDLKTRNQDLQERCDRQKAYVLENMALQQELKKTREACGRITGEFQVLREHMNLQQNYILKICNMLKMYLYNVLRSMSDTLQRYERRSLMIVMEYEAETATEEDFKFMQHMGELKDKFKEFEIKCKTLEDLLNANKLLEVVDLLKLQDIVRIFEQFPNILFDDMSKMIISLSNKNARIRKHQEMGACCSLEGGGDQVNSCEHKSVNEANEYTDENGKYHLLFMRVKDNVYNAENDDIIVQALKEIRRKNNNRMSFLTYGQIVNRVQQRIDDVEENSCCICFHGYDDIPIRVLVCNHKFHKHCIEHWFETNNVCPICRSVISP